MARARTIVGIGKRGTLSRTTSANLAMHDLGDVTPQALIQEAKASISLLQCGTKELLEAKYAEALNSFFKSAAIACNVVFTAKTHDVVVPQTVVDKMCMVSERATHGIKKVMKAIVLKYMISHEKAYHADDLDVEPRRMVSMTPKMKEISPIDGAGEGEST